MMIRPLEWFEENARHALSVADSEERRAMAMLKSAARTRVDFEALLSRVARARKAGKKEMSVK